MKIDFNKSHQHSNINIDIPETLKTYKWKNDVLMFLAVIAIVFFSRLPFLNAGYGLESDGWRVAGAARRIAITGRYTFSRLPGYPLHEMACSLIWKGGPWALNGATAIFSVLGVLFFALSLKKLGCKDYILASLALAFTPVIYINSTVSKDYLWALSFMLGSLYFVLIRRPTVAGIFLGAAIGCRITSGAMLIPLSLLLVQREKRSYGIGDILRFSLFALLVGGVAFIPVIREVGWHFFTFTQPTGYPPLLVFVQTATTGVWGTIGLIAILVATVSLIFRPRMSQIGSSIPKSVPRKHVIAWILIICLYLIAFLRLPQHSGYLIPVVPFVILLLGRFLTRRFFIFVCISLLCSSFFVDIHRSSIWVGPIFNDHSRRIEEMKFIEKVISFGNSLHRKSVIVTAWWQPKIEVSILSKSPGVIDPFSFSNVKYFNFLQTTDLPYYLGRGFKIYYLPKVREYNLEAYGLDLMKIGATPLFADQIH